MFQAYGLYTHIQANRVRSVVLLLGFVALLHALLFSLLLILNAMQGGSFDDIVSAAASQFAGSWPVAALAALAWFAIAWVFHGTMIRAATGATGVTRQEAPKLYNAIENLCVSRGLPMPRLEIVEDPALNAYASGLSQGNYAIAVTRGLLDKLSDAELEAVLAHELTHIRNRDTQMMVIAIIFAGVFAFFGDLAIRRWDFPYGWSPRAKTGNRGYDTSSDQDNRDRDGGGGGGGRDSGGGALLAIALAIVIIIITWGTSTLIRLALSRSREYMADAGSVELTKNPDAMIAALRKIENHAGLNVVSRMEAFYIENPVRNRVSGFLETHPSIEDRIAAIQKFAGGREMPPG